MLLESQEDVFNAIEHAKFIIADQNVLNLYPQIAFLCNQKSTYSISEPEAQKSLCDYEKIIKFFLDKNITRVDEILAIGGGATTDLAGFVAATILRGVEWSVVPTTLLAMIDASIGGKVGINTDEGKNLIGSFHLPIKTYLNQNFLATLPSHEFDSGMGELVKYTFLNLEIRDAILADGFNQKIVLSCYAHKMSIVENDLQEKGNRKSLNLGHSFGHAIEKATNLSHGICVLIGIEIILNLYAPEFLEDLKVIVEKLGINKSEDMKVDLRLFKRFFEQDKKRILNNEIELIIPTKVGQVTVKPIKFQAIYKKMETNEFCTNFFK